MSRMINRLYGRVYGWFDSKDAGPVSRPMPTKFSTSRAKLAMMNLEDRVTPATFTVLNTADSGAGSLRQAMTDANTAAGADNILFNTNSGLGTDFSAGLNSIALLTALPTTNATAGQNLTITGPGADKLVITRGVTTALNRPFSLSGTGLSYTIEKLSVSGFSGTSSGGAIFLSANSTLNLNAVNISGNSGGTGGGIYINNSGVFNVADSTISNNSSSSTGGAIRFFGTVAGNILSITNSTLSGNTATNGGAISLNSTAATTTITNSTITGNSANTTSSAAGYSGGVARGIGTTAMSLTISGSIIAGNTSSQTGANQKFDLSFNAGVTTTIDKSLIGITDGLTFNGADNKTGTIAAPQAAGLGLLGYNGGPTPTHLPRIGSAAIDNGNAASPDQRGVARDATPDIGSVEFVAATPAAVIPRSLNANTTTSGNILTGGGTTYTFTARFTDDAGLDSGSFSAGDFSVSGPGGFNPTLTLGTVTKDNAGDDKQYTVSYSFPAPGGTWDGNDSGIYSIRLNAGEVSNQAAVPVAAGFEGFFLVNLARPTAASTPAGVTTAGGTTYSFNVTYTEATGGTGIDLTTIDNSDITITGPNGFTTAAIAGTKTGTTTVTTAYSFTPPGGTWDGNDNGVYTVTLNNNQVANLVGSTVLGKTLGTFTVAAPAPTAAFNVSPAAVTTAGGTTYAFAVKYTDFTGATGTGIDFSTIGTGDIVVSGPSGFSQVATFVSVDVAANGSPRIGNYTFTAPGGSFDLADNGTYTFAVATNQVSNSATPTPIFVTATNLSGSLLVSIPQTFTVNTLADTVDADPLVTSLREALTSANTSTATQDTINFAASLFTGGPGTITLNTGTGFGQLTISDNVIIDGPDAPGALTISGINGTRIFTITAGGNTVIQDVVITQGNGTNGLGGAALDGGAVTYSNLANSTLTFDRVTISNSSTTGSNDGGAINLSGGTGLLTVRRSTITGNTSPKNGGGIYFNSGGAFLLENSTVSNNIANNASDGNGGGGIYFFGTVTSAAGGFNIRNSTISGNQANSGGALVLRGITGTVTVQNSTITNNTATSTTESATTAGSGGGGIASSTSTPTINVISSIISGNISSNLNSDVTFGAGTSSNKINVNNSAIGDSDGFGLSATSGANLAFGANLLLGILEIAAADAANGVTTASHTPDIASPLLDKGNNLLTLTTDQRGGGTNTTQYPRTKGVTDIGSVERGVSPVPVASSTPANVTTTGGTTYTFTVNYLDSSSKVDFATLDSSDIRVTRLTGPDGNPPATAFDVLATFVSATPASNNSNIVATYSFTAPDGSFDLTDNGKYALSIEANQVKNTPLANSVAAGTLGTFNVAIPVVYTVLNADDGGTGSLRDAIDLANANIGSDLITFDKTFFATPQTLTLASSLPAFINDGVAITGPAGNTFTINGGGLYRFFDTSGLAAGTVFSISNLNLTNGSFAGAGGAIVIGDEDVTLTGVSISNSKATGAGGGIAITGTEAKLTLVNSKVFNNSATGFGGGISASPNSGTNSTVSITNTTIDSNTTASHGGGIDFNWPGTFTAKNSTISRNSSVGTGGGLYMWGSGATGTISNSTIALNTSNSTGGGIVLNSGPGTFTISNSTVTGNKGTTGGGLSFGTWAATVDSTIISGNSGTNADLSGTGTLVLTNSAIGVGTGFTPTSTTNSTPYGKVLNLGNLASNGGTTQTVALGSGSLAIDAGLANGLTTDQRGSARVQGAAADIGAFEFDPNQPGASAAGLVNVTQDLPGVNNPYTFTVTYAIGAPATIKVSTVNGNNNAVLVTFPNASTKLATFVSSNSNVDANSITATYKFNPNATPGDPFTSANNGTYAVSLVDNQVQASNSAFIGTTALGTFTVAIPVIYTVLNVDDAGPGSLRDAIAQANADGTTSTIRFSSLFNSGVNTIALSGGEIIVNQSVAIEGTGAGRLVINGGGARIFNVNGVGTLDFTLSGATITGASAADGGAILNADEVITLDSVFATGNKATTNGAVVSSASAAAQTIVRNSTISGNSAGRGALYFTSSATVTVINSTLSGNTASLVGGAIAGYSTGTGDRIVIRNSTIVGNSAPTGGAIRVTGSTSGVLLDSSVVAGNTAGTGPDIASAGVTATNSVISQTGSYVVTSYTGGLPEGTSFASLLLAPLSGSPLPTHAITSASSPLVNIGANTQNLAFDERGSGFPRVVGANADIGAFEFDPNQPGASAAGLVNVTQDLPGVNNPYTFTVTYAIGAPATIKVSTVNGNNNAVLVTFPNASTKLATFVSSTSNVDASSITATYKFNPNATPGAPFTAANNGTYTVSLVGNQVQASNANFIAAGTLGTFTVAIPATYQVTNFADSGAGSLRQAILDSNATPGAADTIQFVTSTGVFTGIAGESTITLLSELPSISDAVTINGVAGKDFVVISGANTYRVLSTFAAPAAAAITINDVTLTGGSVFGQVGAGLLIVDENVTLNRSIVTGNTATSDFVNYDYAAGAGIALNGGAGKLTLNNSTISNNSTDGEGGGIYVAGGTPTLRITESTLSGNTAAEEGGGIYFFNGGSLLLDRSTVSGNFSNGALGGGGIYFFGTISTPADGIGFKVRNSTFSGNSAASAGGGIVFRGGNAANAPSFVNSTFTGNTGSTGGAIANTTVGTHSIISTIITGNTGTDPDVSFTNGTAVVTNSAIGVVPVFAGFDYTAASNKDAASSTAAALGLNATLANNGGPTQTHAITSTGTAFNAGSNPDNQATDQKGAGSSRSQAGGVDIGAVEATGAVTPTVTGYIVAGNNAPGSQRSRVTTIEVTFAGAVTPGQFNGIGDITLTRIGLASNGSGLLGTVIRTGGTGGQGVITVTQGAGNSLILTFSNSGAVPPASVPGIVEYGSLSDGVWELTLPTANNYNSTTAGGEPITRLFGDINGDGTVEGGADFGAFGTTFGLSTGNPGYVSDFDFNQDGTIEGGVDFSEFGARFGASV